MVGIPLDSSVFPLSSATLYPPAPPARLYPSSPRSQGGRREPRLPTPVPGACAAAPAGRGRTAATRLRFPPGRGRTGPASGRRCGGRRRLPARCGRRGSMGKVRGLRARVHQAAVRPAGQAAPGPAPPAREAAPAQASAGGVAAKVSGFRGPRGGVAEHRGPRGTLRPAGTPILPSPARRAPRTRRDVSGFVRVVARSPRQFLLGGGGRTTCCSVGGPAGACTRFSRRP